MNYKPQNTQDVIPYLVVDDVDGLIEFLQKTFDGKLMYRMTGENNRAMHAEVLVGDSNIMMGSSSGQPPIQCMLYVYVPDVDETYKRALAAGAEVVRPVEDQYYGDRSGGVKDAWGNQWWFSTHKESLSEQEIQKRHDEQMKQREG